MSVDKHGEVTLEEEVPLLLPDKQAPELTQVENTTQLMSVIADDCQVLNHVTTYLIEGWKNVRTIDSLCKLTLTTCKFLETKRRLLNLQLGAPTDTRTRSKWDEPYDQ